MSDRQYVLNELREQIEFLNNLDFNKMSQEEKNEWRIKLQKLNAILIDYINSHYENNIT